MEPYLVIRTPSGISGDMILTGLVKLSGYGESRIEELAGSIGIPQLCGCLRVREVAVDGVTGWRAFVSLEDDAHARTYEDILRILQAGRLTAGAKSIASGAFSLLARAEAEVHGIEPARVAFHEIGALDSLLDICLAAALYDSLGFQRCFVSPLPVCDGRIDCEHGPLASPAPAVLKMLGDIPVYGIDSEGETVTPTALALLKAFGSVFGPWPAIRIKETVRVYGGRLLPNIPNGALMAAGEPYPAAPGRLEDEGVPG